jgi:putative tricarboxylic transport membrane protein
VDLLGALGAGFAVALRPENLMFCFMGVFIGTLIGVLPGIGPVGAMSLLLPATYQVTPEAAVIMLAGIYYGAMYGGSTTSILVNIPGEAASVVTCLDGYQMARRGRAGPALGISAIGSFVGGTLSIVGLTLLAPPLTTFALKFGPPEYFALMVLGLTILVYLAHGSMAKALLSAALGVVLGLVGLDAITAQPRLTFDRMELVDGVGLVPLVMGLFGVAEVLVNLEEGLKREIFKTRLGGLLPSRQDWKASTAPMARGSLLGFLLGILPGGGAVISSFLSYAVEKRVSKRPEEFGHGAIAGVAGPEAANNAATGGAFIPLMTLGIPPNVVMAMLLGAFMIHGVQPGPLMMAQKPELFWGVITSMYIGNLMLLILNLPLIGLWVQVLKVPYRILFPLILLFCLVGAYSVANTVFDIYVMLAFGALGYGMKKLRYEGAPLVLAFVLGPLLENNLRKSLILSQGDFAIFVTRPIAAVCLAIALFLLVSPLVPALARRRARVPVEDAPTV